ncbi:MAG: hypothetical protein KAG61_07430 [Bacteriovoracaceae bacterium]|nr:hypothetical protein [Bacteriovoracaceae bacterium]
MANDTKNKRKLARDKKKKQDRHYKVTKKTEGMSDTQVKNGRWLLYLLGLMVVASCGLVFWNMR